jgi:hypothetical protein
MSTLSERDDVMARAKEIGDRAWRTVRALLALRDESIRTFAKRLKSSGQYMQECLQGFHPGSQVPERMARDLGISVSEFFRDPVMTFRDYKEEHHGKPDDKRGRQNVTAATTHHTDVHPG